MKCNLAIFDLDGTLFDTSNVNYFAYSEAMEEYNFNIDYSYFISECNGKHYREFLSKLTQNNDIIEQIHNRKKELYSYHLEKARPNIHLFNILKSLKNQYNISLVTTASKKNCFEILNYFDKYNLFDLILTHEDVRYVKPNPEGFIKAMEFFEIDANNTIVFEDSDVGIEAAKKLCTNIIKVEKF